jgi:lysophospholipase L1-like esterase
MTDALLSLRSEGIPVFSLLQIFSGVEDTLYDDPIHLKRDVWGESLGYRLMAEKIAHTLAESWKLRGKRSRMVSGER